MVSNLLFHIASCNVCWPGAQLTDQVQLSEVFFCRSIIKETSEDRAVQRQNSEGLAGGGGVGQNGASG